MISLQAKYAHTMISNALQTNGTLINEEWAGFFKRYNFLVGISLDGPEPVHNAHRITGSGKGSYNSVMRGVGHLQNEGVEYSILTVIHEDNVMNPDELMAFYQEQQFPYIQFIPCMDFVSQKSDMPGRFRITPKQDDFLLMKPNMNYSAVAIKCSTHMPMNG